MSTNKTCAISSLRWLPISALIYGLADFSKHESAHHCRRNSFGTRENRKNLLAFEDGRKKRLDVSERTDNPDTGAGIICRLSNRRRHDKVFWVLPRRWRNYSALLARHEQTIHAGSRPEKKAVARE